MHIVDVTVPKKICSPWQSPKPCINRYFHLRSGNSRNQHWIRKLGNKGANKEWWSQQWLRGAREPGVQQECREPKNQQQVMDPPWSKV